MPKFPTKEQLESTEEGCSGVDHIATSPIPGVEESPGVPAKWLGSALRIIASRAVPLTALIDRLGLVRLSKAPSDPADPTALAVEERGAAGGVASLGADSKVPNSQSQVPSTHVGSRDGHPTATTTAAGFISGADKAKVHDRLHGVASQDHSDVRNAPQDGQAVIFRQAGAQGAGYYHESPGAASVPNATETEAGKVEKGTRADYDANTDQGTSGPLYVPITLLKALLTPEAVRLVGATGEPAFQNGWVNYGPGREAAGFYKDPLGRVHLQGTVKSGSGNTAAFMLPAGYRPGAVLSFVPALIDGAASPGRAEVKTNGEVVFTTVSPADASLNGISFRAVQ